MGKESWYSCHRCTITEQRVRQTNSWQSEELCTLLRTRRKIGALGEKIGKGYRSSEIIK